MNKFFLSVCAVIFLSVTMIIGGVFAVFNYATAPADQKEDTLITTINQFKYPFFTQAMTDMMNFADGTKGETGGLNPTVYLTSYYAGNPIPGVMHAYLSSSPYRKKFGYVGSMDDKYNANNVNFQADESISVVMRYVLDEQEEPVHKIYLYMAEITREELDAKTVGEEIVVFKVGYQYAIINGQYGYYLIKDAEGNPVVEQGTSKVKLYETEDAEVAPGTKTFGYHGGAEIFVKDNP